jgi:hypothetical protein
VGNQDSDKRRTYGHARQTFSALWWMLFVDRDELMFCPGAVQSKAAQISTQVSLYNRTKFRGMFLCYDVIVCFDLALLGAVVAELNFQWVYYAPIHPSNTSSVAGDEWYQTTISSCVLQAYKAKSLSAYLKCFGGFAVSKDKSAGKSADVGMGDFCPFYGLHKGCYRCKCRSFKLPISE